jgi:hypothetical protein
MVSANRYSERRKVGSEGPAVFSPTEEPRSQSERRVLDHPSVRSVTFRKAQSKVTIPRSRVSGLETLLKCTKVSRAGNQRALPWPGLPRTPRAVPCIAQRASPAGNARGLWLGWVVACRIRPSLFELIPGGLELTTVGAINLQGGRPADTDSRPFPAVRARRRVRAVICVGHADVLQLAR